MATEVGSLYYDLDIDDKKLRGQLADADKQIKNFGDSLANHWDNSVQASKRIFAGVAVAGAAVTAFGISSVKAYADSEKHIAALANTLKSTNNVSGQTVQGLRDMATQLQATTGYSDEFVMEAQNMLLTFTAIGKDLFPQVTRATIDMARQFGGDAQQNAIRLGKALQDPIAGVGALSKIGVQFSEVQKQQIENFVKAGNVMGAQKIILGEIATQTKGAAEAYGKTFAGQVDILKNSFDDLKEGIGQMLVGGLQPLTEHFAGWMTKVSEAGGLLAYLKQLFYDNEGTIRLISGAILGALVPAVVALTLSFGGLVLSLAPFMLVGAGLLYLWDKNRLLFWALVGAVTGLAVAFTAVMMPAIIASTVAFGTMAVAVIAATWPFVLIGVAAAAAAYLIIQNWDRVKNFLSGIWDWISRNWPSIIGMLSNPFGEAAKRIFGIIADLAARARDKLWSFYGQFVDAGWGLITAFANGIKGAAYKVYDAVRDVASKARKLLPFSDAKEGPFSDLTLSGQRFSETFAKGVTNSSDAIYGAIENALALPSNLLSPTMNASLAGGAVGSGGVSNVSNAHTIVNIDTINDKSDADYIFNRLDRNQSLVNRGGSPA